jgi:hypothetical protein
MRYPEFGDFCDVAASVLSMSPEQVSRLPNVGLAQSALEAPRAGFGEVEVYPTLLEKAAVLLERLGETTRCQTAANVPRSSWPASSSKRTDARLRVPIPGATYRSWSAWPLAKPDRQRSSTGWEHARARRPASNRLAAGALSQRARQAAATTLFRERDRFCLG